jgi:hypothetical protein
MVEPIRKTYVMMSFSVEDTKQVDQILEILDRYNISYFEFRRSIEPGQDIIDCVLNAIDLCTHVFIYASAASIKSPWVWFEVGIATALGRSLVFVLDHPSTELPLPFNRLRHVTSEEEFDALAKMLGDRGTPLKVGRREMIPVENFTKSKLYYHEGGWASAIWLWGAEDISFPRERVSLKYENISLETPVEPLQSDRRKPPGTTVFSSMALILACSTSGYRRRISIPLLR